MAYISMINEQDLSFMFLDDTPKPRNAKISFGRPSKVEFKDSLCGGGPKDMMGNVDSC